MGRPAEIDEDDPIVRRTTEMIRNGQVAELTTMLEASPGLGGAWVVSRQGADVEKRSMLHVVTDWPGNVPNGPALVALLVGAGADVNARFVGTHSETPLHWAASADDVQLIDALVDAGAEVDADGAVIAGGTPLDNAVAFGQWRAAQRLVARGAAPALWHAAALGLVDLVVGHFEGRPLAARFPWGRNSVPEPGEVDVAFWCACHGGQATVAAYLLGRGADRNWVAPWDGLTPLDAATRSNAEGVVSLLDRLGARSAHPVGGGDDRRM